MIEGKVINNGKYLILTESGKLLTTNYRNLAITHLFDESHPLHGKVIYISEPSIANDSQFFFACSDGSIYL